MVTYRIGIIGFGSIGEKHFVNIVSVLNEKRQSYTIDLIRSGKGIKLSTVISEQVNQIFYVEDAIPDDYDIIFITNPTNLHFDTIKNYIKKTKHMFIEKPVFDKLEIPLCELALKCDGVYYVACPMRYTDVIQYLKKECNLENVYSVRSICSSYLPEWRPDKDYRNNYSAHAEQGGGVSIDLIHEWDYLCYLFGQPEKVLNIRGTFSRLEIDSEDLSVYIAAYKSMLIELHLDYFGRNIIREIQIFTDEDTIVGDLINSEVRNLKSGEIVKFNEDINDCHRKELVYFFDVIEGRECNNNDISMALRTLQIAKGENEEL